MKLITNIMRITGLIIAIPLSIPCILLGWLGIVSDRFADVAIVISKIPFYVGEHTRYFYYKATLKKVGENVIFKFGSFCQYRNTYIGNNVLIGFYTTLGEISIGNDVLIGGYVNFLSGTIHNTHFPIQLKKLMNNRLKVEE